MGVLPAGMVTLVFTEIEGSTRLLEHLGEDAYDEALSEHHRILRRPPLLTAGWRSTPKATPSSWCSSGPPTRWPRRWTRSWPSLVTPGATGRRAGAHGRANRSGASGERRRRR